MQSSPAKIFPVVHRAISSFRSFRRSLHPDTTVGFVPTMGALHEGHLSLVEEARLRNDIVVASIFVNPTQFGVGEDFDKYPRQLEQDTNLLAEFGVDHLFAPSKDDMYGRDHVTYVVPDGFDNIPEGKFRPGHFKGVSTIVTKLFNIVRPTNAYFGQKDAVQCSLIKRIVEDLNMDLNVVVMDTIREEDGLAMSSRNAYLSPEERRAAPIVYKALCYAKKIAEEEVSSIPSSKIIEIVREILLSEPLVSEIQYVSVDSKATMQQMDLVQKNGTVISVACKIGSVRLIDNIVL